MLSNYDFKKAIILSLLLTVLVVILAVYLQYQSQVNYELQLQKEAQIFNDGYEVGRLDQLTEISEENSCYNISKNQELNRLLKKYFSTCNEAKLMWAIAQAESSGRQTITNKNTNGSYDCGWLQVNTIHRYKGETKESFCNRMHDLEQNISLAKQVKDKQGLSAWVQYKNNAYLTYLK